MQTHVLMPCSLPASKKTKQVYFNLYAFYTHACMHPVCSHYTHSDDQSCKALTCRVESPFCELGTELFISRFIMPMHMVITAVVVSFRVGGRSYRYKLILKQPDHKQLSKAQCSFLCIHKQAVCIAMQQWRTSVKQTSSGESSSTSNPTEVSLHKLISPYTSFCVAGVQLNLTSDLPVEAGYWIEALSRAEAVSQLIDQVISQDRNLIGNYFHYRLIA